MDISGDTGGGMDEIIASSAARLSESGNAVMSCGELDAALSVAAPVAPTGDGTIQGGPAPDGSKPGKGTGAAAVGASPADRRRQAMQPSRPRQAAAAGPNGRGNLL
jgi:hypothetical protein